MRVSARDESETVWKSLWSSSLIEEIRFIALDVYVGSLSKAILQFESDQDDDVVVVGVAKKHT
jgi:hypothetical protein